MKPFRLAGLLRVRDIEEQRAAAELAEAGRAVDAVRAHRSRMRGSLGAMSPGAMPGAMPGGQPGALPGAAPREALLGQSAHVDAATLSAVVAARASAHILLGELSALHERAEQTAADARSAHQVARVNARSLEKLQVRHVESETERDRRAEQSALDEVAIQGWRAAERRTR